MTETWREHQIRQQLPEEIRDVCQIDLSKGRGLAIAQRHLETIYGDRANWARNLQRYYDVRYRSQLRLSTSSVDEIPELTIDDIESWVAEEERFHADTSRLQEFYALMGDPNPEVQRKSVNEAAGIMGLLGPRPRSIYQHVIDWDGITQEELGQIAQRRSASYKKFALQ